MPQATCLKAWVRNPENKLAFQSGDGCSAFCHVERSRNEDGTYNICGARYQEVQRTLATTALELQEGKECVAEASILARPDALVATNGLVTPELVDPLEEAA